jgi:hypothetical protein
MGNCRFSFMDAAQVQRKLRLPALRAQTVAEAEYAEARALSDKVRPPIQSSPVTITREPKSEPATPKPLCHEHREKVSHWGTLYACTAWDCPWGTDVDGNWKRKTHSNQKVALPFDPAESLVEDAHQDIDQEQERELGVTQAQVPVAGQDDSSEDDIEAEDSGDDASFAA